MTGQDQKRSSAMADKHVAPVLKIGSVNFQGTQWLRDHLQQGDMGQAIFLKRKEQWKYGTEGTYKKYFSLNFVLFK